jgi:hypothetical protein
MRGRVAGKAVEVYFSPMSATGLKQDAIAADGVIALLGWQRVLGPGRGGGPRGDGNACLGMSALSLERCGI